MKVREQESQDLWKVLQQRGLGPGDVKLWKKKGWLHIQLLSSDRVFAFHRADNVKLIEGAFMPDVGYRVNRDGSIQYYADWLEVLLQFQLWLDQLTKR